MTTKREIFVLDSWGNPVENTLIVAHESNMTIKNKQIITSTDKKGKALVSLFGLVDYSAGKEGYYPTGIISRESNVKITLFTKPEQSTDNLSLEYDRIFLKRKLAYVIEGNELWEAWIKYLRWLDDKGFFKKFKAKKKD
jgi:hypothetical protein